MFADDLAAELVRTLDATNRKIAFAESCTAGLIAATCGRIPGVSEVLAGSAVVYQVATKIAWLDVDESVVQQHGVVSRQVSEQMAAGVLKKTPHADVAVSITGHLGPNAPAELDGIAWCCVAIRRSDGISLQPKLFHLSTSSDRLPRSESDKLTIRHERQRTATRLAMEFCIQNLQDREG